MSLADFSREEHDMALKYASVLKSWQLNKWLALGHLNNAINPSWDCSSGKWATTDSDIQLNDDLLMLGLDSVRL